MINIFLVMRICDPHYLTYSYENTFLNSKNRSHLIYKLNKMRKDLMRVIHADNRIIIPQSKRDGITIHF